MEVCERGVKIDGRVGMGAGWRGGGTGYCCVLSNAVCP